MIWCPQCGTANREGSKFCNNCGTRLEPESGLKCPMCGRVNPLELETCPNCGARLKPLAATPQAAEETGEPIAETPEQPTAEGPVELGDPEAEAPQEGTPEPASIPESPEGEGWVGEGEEPPYEPRDEEFQEPGEEVTPGPYPQELDLLEPEPETAVLEEEKAEAEETEPIVEEAVYAPPAPSLLATAAAVGSEQATLFQKIVSRTRPVSPPIVRKERVPAGRWLLYLTLVLALLLPLLLGESLALGVSISPGAWGFYDALNTLPPGSQVIITHDYDPGTAAELLPQARAILRHLAERGANVVSLSLVPQGPALAQKALDQTLAASGYNYGADYLNLGYVAGGEAGLRSLARGSFFALAKDYIGGQDFLNYPLAQEFSSIQDVDLVVVLAATQQDLRLWIEQVQTPFQVQMVAGVSAQVDPSARPYYRSGQIAGLLSGLVGAAEYERITGHAGSALSSAAAQAFGQGAMVIFIILGNLVLILSPGRGGRR